MKKTRRPSRLALNHVVIKPLTPTELEKVGGACEAPQVIIDSTPAAGCIGVTKP